MYTGFRGRYTNFRKGLNMMVNEELLKLITGRVIDKITKYNAFKIPVGVSNRHVHVTSEDLETLFGKGYQLTKKRVRILGPVRKQSQIEISKTDSFRLGVKAPIRESGDLTGTPGLEMVGPKGTVWLPRGAIVALRHIHMTPQQAEAMGVWDKDIVEVETFGERHGVFGDVLIRVSEQFELEMHVDVDEANACALKNNDYVIIRR